MEYEIRNEFLKVCVDSRGGELISIRDQKDREYMWQGDEATWPDQGPNLFPYIARLTDGSYVYQGKTYHMDIHGFLMYMDMDLDLSTCRGDKLVMRLESSPETLKKYPFAFSLEMIWELKGTVLEISYRVYNRDDKIMYFGVGGHPGFQVPMEEGTDFEDYYLDFGPEAKPLRVGMSEDCFVTGEDTPFLLRENRYLDLRHDLFDDDAIILREMPRTVTLASKKGTHSIEVSYPDMPYLGIWHWPRTKVPYLCIEPWSSLPSRKGIVEDLGKQENLISLGSGEMYENTWSVKIQ